MIDLDNYYPERWRENEVKWPDPVARSKAWDLMHRGFDYLNLGIYLMAAIPILILIVIYGTLVAIADEVL